MKHGAHARSRHKEQDMIDRLPERATAHDEAGRAVACWSLGFRIKPITIAPKGEASGFVTWLRALRFSSNSGLTRRSVGRYHDRIVCTLAGQQARRRFNPQGIRNKDLAGDTDLVTDLLLRLHGEERECNSALKYLEARARNLVERHWCTIEDLAKALLESQSLTGKEIADALRVSRSAQERQQVQARI
jgi:ATP-dependent Zn protease